MKPLVIFKTGTTFDTLISDQGDFEDWIIDALNEYMLPIIIVDPREAENLPDHSSVLAAIITGSHAMVTDRESWSENLADWLKVAVNEQIPILGICYGHQLLAHAMEGYVDYHPGGLEIGTVSIELTSEAKDDILFKDIPQTFLAHTTHRQTVIHLPRHAVLLARNSFEPHHSFRIGNCAWGVQFHPEFNKHAMRRYIENRCELAHQKILLANPSKETPEASTLLLRFAEFSITQHRQGMEP